MAEYRCSSCKNEYESSGGVKYCVKCQEYLFTPCIENKEDMSTLPPQKVQRTSQPECSVWSCSGTLPMMPTDQDNIATNLCCRRHNRLACLLCFSIAYNDNKEVSKLSQSVNENLIDIQVRTLKDVQMRQQNLEDELPKMKENCLREIQNFRLEINHKLDRMEQVSITELENIFKEIESILRDNRNSIDIKLEDLAKMDGEKKQMQENLPEHFESETFGRGSSANVKESLFGHFDITMPGPVFLKNTKLLESLGKFHSLGVFHFPREESLYRIQSEERVNVADESDKEDCSIHSACFTGTGDVLLADFKNKNVKVLDCTDYKTKDVLPLQHYPLSVCNVSNDEAAIGLAEKLYFGGSNMIQFLSTKEKLVPTRTIKLDHCCTGICVVGSEIFVSNQRKRLYIYNLKGVLQKVVHLDQTGTEIFSKSYSMTESDNGKMVHVTDLNRGLVTLDRDGNVVWKFFGPELKMAWGVCTDGKGFCFVAGSNSGNVVQIGSSGNYVGEVVSASRGIKDPQAICFDKKKSRLIVTRYNCNTIHIFSLH